MLQLLSNFCYSSCGGTLQSLKPLHSSTQMSADGPNGQCKSSIWLTEKVRLGLLPKCHKWGTAPSLVADFSIPTLHGCHGSREVCLPWLSYPLINRKHLWHQPRSAITHAAMQSCLENQIWRSRLAISTKLKLYNTCILPIFLYGSDCWAISETDARKIDALDQWCLRISQNIEMTVFFYF